MKDNPLILSNISLEQFREIFGDTLKEQLANFAPLHKPEEEYLTPKQVAKELNVSKVTLRAWEKQNILKPSRLGSRVRYLRSNINQALATVKKYERRTGQ